MGTVCDACGSTYSIGDWPFCKGDPAAHVPARHFGDEPMDSYIDHELTEDGTEITTRGQRRALERAAHAEPRESRYKRGPALFFDLGAGRK